MTSTEPPAKGFIARTLGRRTRSGRPLWLAIVAGLVVALAVYGLMRKQQQPSPAEQPAEAPAGLVLPEQGANTSLAAVGPLRGLDQPCTGWLVAPQPAAAVASEGSAASGTASPSQSPGGSAAPVLAQGPAYAVTAAACVGITDSTQVVAGRRLTGVTLGLNAFARVTSAAASTLRTVPVTEVVWASARWLNLAVLRLDVNYEDLRADGIYPIRLAGQPEPGTQVLSATVPVAEVAADEQFLRISTCRTGEVSDVLAGPWVWQQVQASDCRGILGGSLGGAAFDPAGNIVGMVVGTTIAASGAVGECGASRPCQVSGGTVTSKSDTTYLQPVSVLGDCFADSRFQLGGACALEDPATVVPAAAQSPAGKPGDTVEVDLTSPYSGTIADKHGALPLTQCQDPQDWSRPVPARAWRLRLELPSQPGWLLACVGSPTQPTPVVVEVDTTPPDPSAIRLHISEVKGGREVAPVLDPPEYSAFLWTSGPKNVIECAIAEGYQRYRGDPAFLQAADLPATVCLVAEDAAGNRSAPVGRPVD